MLKQPSTSTERPPTPAGAEIAVQMLQKPTRLCLSRGRVLNAHAKRCAQRWAHQQAAHGAYFGWCGGFIAGTVCVRYFDKEAFAAVGGVGWRAHGFDVVEALVKIYYAARSGNCATDGVTPPAANTIELPMFMRLWGKRE